MAWNDDCLSRIFNKNALTYYNSKENGNNYILEMVIKQQ